MIMRREQRFVGAVLVVGGGVGGMRAALDLAEESREKEQITLEADDVAAVLAKMTGIPLFRMEPGQFFHQLRLQPYSLIFILFIITLTSSLFTLHSIPMACNALTIFNASVIASLLMHSP